MRRRRISRQHHQRAGAAAPRVEEVTGTDRSGSARGIDGEAVAGRLLAAVADCWARGWQPADLVRTVRRELRSDAVALLLATLAEDIRPRAELGWQVAPAWMAQLHDAGVEAGDVPVDVVAASGLAPDRLAGAAHALRTLLERLPELPRLAPPPEDWHPGMRTARPSSGPVTDDLLARVRALLAKAESTTFDAEAEAFTAKAQELMTRHRIDRALLDAGRLRASDAEQPGGHRIPIDNPYVEAKAALLSIVAEANGARAVWTKAFGFATVLGFPTDVAVVEELFTSLLVQATAAMQREGTKVDRAGRSRTTRFRRTFLVAYASRIGERLRDAAEAAVADAAGDDRGVLPVLAARDDEVAAAADEVFPHVATFTPSATDAEGWHAGTAHADRADLSAGPRLEP